MPFADPELIIYNNNGITLFIKWNIESHDVIIKYAVIKLNFSEKIWFQK